MKKIRIPHEYVEAIIQVGELDDAAVQEIVANFEKQTASLYDSDLSERVVKELKLTDASIAEGIVDAVVSMYPSSYMGEGFSVEAFADAIVADLVKRAEEVISVDSLLKIRKNLVSLLGVKVISVAAKGTGLALENPRNYMSSHIMTDIRSVFCEQADQIDAAVLIQTLTINYVDLPSGRKQFSLALDSVDIRSLINVLERAEKKANVIREKMQAASTLILEPYSQEGDE